MISNDSGQFYAPSFDVFSLDMLYPGETYSVFINGSDDIDFDQREILIAEHRRNKRAVSINFEYRFGAFQKKKYRREDGHGHSHGDEGMDAGY